MSNFVYELYSIFILLMIQFGMLFPYWIVGIIAASVLTALFNNQLETFAMKIKKTGTLLGVFLFALLGAISPMCMYGTIPIIAALGKKGMPHHFLVSFMISSILINPNLFVFSFALGPFIALLRLAAALLAGIIAGLVVKTFKMNVYDFKGFQLVDCNQNNRTKLKSFLHTLNSMIIKTFPYLLIGMVITALFQQYVPSSLVSNLTGNNNIGIFLTATLGIPLYTCGGGTIPMLKIWLASGMSTGAALSFMLTGPATKFNNLSAVKAILGIKNFIIYITYAISFGILYGFIVNLLIK